MAASLHEHEEEASWSDIYSFNLVPSEAFLKFRKEVEGFRVGLNFDLISSERSQIGVGRNFRYHTTGWKWKLSTCFGGDGISQIRNKTSVHVFPAMTIRFGWRAEYILPEVHGAIGSGEPVIGMNYGRLYASLDRVETILRHKA
ncbi:hypothetical protein EJ110_NYTH49629 [Nymphaea thermarum]|nr:hypothetical protein EJ110_NYTH49629 [Nymphaea thermarum]